MVYGKASLMPGRLGTVWALKFSGVPPTSPRPMASALVCRTFDSGSMGWALPTVRGVCEPADVAESTCLVLAPVERSGVSLGGGLFMPSVRLLEKLLRLICVQAIL